VRGGGGKRCSLRRALHRLTAGISSPDYGEDMYAHRSSEWRRRGATGRDVLTIGRMRCSCNAKGACG
jgi:hypothetical protein